MNLPLEQLRRAMADHAKGKAPCLTNPWSLILVEGVLGPSKLSRAWEATPETAMAILLEGEPVERLAGWSWLMGAERPMEDPLGWWGSKLPPP